MSLRFLLAPVGGAVLLLSSDDWGSLLGSMIVDGAVSGAIMMARCHAASFRGASQARPSSSSSSRRAVGETGKSDSLREAKVFGPHEQREATTGQLHRFTSTRPDWTERMQRISNFARSPLSLLHVSKLTGLAALDRLSRATGTRRANVDATTKRAPHTRCGEGRVKP